MTLLELIAYCKLKDRVTRQYKMRGGTRRTMILTRGYEVLITYTKNGYMIENSVYDYKDGTICGNVTEEDLAKYLLGPNS